MTYFGHDTLLSGWRRIASTLSPGLSAGIKKDLQSLGEGPLQQVLKKPLQRGLKAYGVFRQVRSAHGNSLKSLASKALKRLCAL